VADHHAGHVAVVVPQDVEGPVTGGTGVADDRFGVVEVLAFDVGGLREREAATSAGLGLGPVVVVDGVAVVLVPVGFPDGLGSLEPPPVPVVGGGY
jgi:hypothetical protein